MAKATSLSGSGLFVGRLVKQRIEAIDRQVPLACLADQLSGAGEEGALFHLDGGRGSPVDAQPAGAVLFQNPLRKEDADGCEHFVPGHMAGAGQFGGLRQRIVGFEIPLDEGDDHRVDQLPGPVSAAVIHGWRWKGMEQGVHIRYDTRAGGVLDEIAG